MKLIFTCAVVLLLASCKKGISDSTTTNPVTYKDSVFTSYFRRTSGWVAGDGANSISLNNGNSLWLFGDSHIGFYDAATNTVPCLFQVHNAGLAMGITNPQNQTTLTSTASPASYFYFGGNNTYWFWPGSGYANTDTAYIFLERIKSVSGSFAVVDSSYVAKVKIADMSVAGYAVLPSKNGIDFSKGVVKDGANVYIYGIKSGSIGNDLFVARFSPTNIYGAWEYYGSGGWSTNLSSIQKIHSEFTSSFDVCKIKNKYVLITTEFSVGCDQGKNIYSYTSDQPYGPFTNKKTIWTLNDTLQGHYPVFYLANTHAEYDNGKNELLITYCINGYDNCINICNGGRKNPDYYRPKAIRVPYKVIDASL